MNSSIWIFYFLLSIPKINFKIYKTIETMKKKIIVERALIQNDFTNVKNNPLFVLGSFPINEITPIKIGIITNIKK